MIWADIGSLTPHDMKDLDHRRGISFASKIFPSFIYGGQGYFSFNQGFIGTRISFENNLPNQSN
jgi:hypothetical protein